MKPCWAPREKPRLKRQIFATFPTFLGCCDENKWCPEEDSNPGISARDQTIMFEALRRPPLYGPQRQLSTGSSPPGPIDRGYQSPPMFCRGQRHRPSGSRQGLRYLVSNQELTARLHLAGRTLGLRSAGAPASRPENLGLGIMSIRASPDLWLRPSAGPATLPEQIFPRSVALR
jgi:hypothetical protein